MNVRSIKLQLYSTSCIDHSHLMLYLELELAQIFPLEISPLPALIIDCYTICPEQHVC